MGGVFADGNFVRLEIFRHFPCGHDFGQNKFPHKKAIFIREGTGLYFFIDFDFSFLIVMEINAKECEYVGDSCNLTRHSFNGLYLIKGSV